MLVHSFPIFSIVLSCLVTWRWERICFPSPVVVVVVVLVVLVLVVVGVSVVVE